MFAFDSHVKDLFVIGAFFLRTLQPLDLVIIQRPAHSLLEFAPADLLLGLGFLSLLDLRLEPRLHFEDEVYILGRCIAVAAQ